MKNKLPARILAALLALVLVLSLCPNRAGRGGRNRLHRLSASAAGLCQDAAARIPIQGTDRRAHGRTVTTGRRRRLYPDLPRRLRRTGTQDHRPWPDGELLGVRPFQPRGERCVRPEPAPSRARWSPPGRRRTSAASSARWCPTSRCAFPPADVDELQTELNALQSLIKRTLEDAQSASDSVTGGAGAWTLTLPADGEESHTIRWRVPADGAKRYTVYTAADGGWKKAQTSTVGSYLCFALPSDSAQFAVVPAMSCRVAASGRPLRRRSRPSPP